MAFATDASGNIIIDQNGNPVQESDTGTIADLVTKGLAILNSQQVFQLNLDRLQRGLQPIPPQYAAPTINFGLAGVSTQAVMIGAAALLAFAFMKKNHNHR